MCVWERGMVLCCVVQRTICSCIQLPVQPCTKHSLYSLLAMRGCLRSGPDALSDLTLVAFCLTCMHSCLSLSASSGLFMIEGILAVLVSVQFFFMPRDIDHMRSLTPAERDALNASMAHHAKPATDVKKVLVAALKNPAVWMAGGGIKFFRDVAFYGERLVAVLCRGGGLAAVPWCVCILKLWCGGTRSWQ